MSGRVGAFPGSFNPPTVAHLAVAEAAVARAGLARVDLVVSRRALGKEDLEIPTLADRLALLDEIATARPWLGVAVTDSRLIVDIAEGYDAVVMGADKWRQVTDPAWYADDARARDAAVARLPRPLVVARAGDHPEGVDLIVLDEVHHHVNATAFREGDPTALAWLLPEAVAFDIRTGAWSDPERYRRSLGPDRSLDPTDPTGSTGPDRSLDPTDPTGSTGPVRSLDPLDPTDPAG